jgi:hypothetical protein
MKKLQLFKSANDFALASININDPANFDVAAAQQFQKEGFNSADYTYWRQCVTNLVQNFRTLNNQLAPSVMIQPAKPVVGPTPVTAQPADAVKTE